MKPYYSLLVLLLGGGWAGAVTELKPDPDKPPLLYVKHYNVTVDRPYAYRFDTFDSDNVDYWWNEFHSPTAHHDHHWDSGVESGGSESYASNGNGFHGSSFSQSSSWSSEQHWPASFLPDQNGTQTATGDYNWSVFDPIILPPVIIGEHCSFNYRFVTDYEIYQDEAYGPQAPHDLEKDWWYGNYTRSADEELKLKTGGKAASKKQSLFKLSASATQYIPYNTSPWRLLLDYISVPISPTAISVDGKNLGADANLWRVYADNDERTVTPHVDGVDYFAYDLPTPTKYKVKIVVNNNPLWPDHVPRYNNYCVGTDMNFSTSWLPSTPPYVDASSYFHWSLPGEFYNATTTPCSACSTDPFLNASLLENKTTSAWWVSKSDPDYTASVGMNLLFPNGQNASIAALGKFIMLRPKSTVTSVTDTVAMDSIYGGIPHLRFGNSQEGYNPGIKFFATIQPPDFFPNYTNGEWIQVISSALRRYQANSTGAWYRFEVADVLDTDNPYPTDDDAPASLPLSSFKAVEITDSFDRWLMFQPPDGHLVPLNIASWNWHGTGGLSGSTWSGSGGNAINPTGHETTSYPKWTNNVANFFLKSE